MTFDWTDLDGTRHLWDDGPRTYTRWAPGGVVQQTRPYTAEENARADAEAAYATQAANRATIEARMDAAIARDREIIAQINGVLPGTVASLTSLATLRGLFTAVRDLAQQDIGEIRLLRNNTTATD